MGHAGLHRRRRFRLSLLSAVLLLAGVLTVASVPTANAATSLPSGFSLETVETGQAPYSLTDFAVLPDGSRITAGKAGALFWVSANEVIRRSLGKIPVHGHADIGLLSIWLAPDYDTSGHLYALYPTPGPDVEHPGQNEIARYTIVSPAAPTSINLGSKKVVLTGISQNINYHGAGTVIAVPDGSIYASLGDAAGFNGVEALALRAQNVDDPHGKILRVDVNGNGWPANPFFDKNNPRSWRSRVFAMGLRNPTRFVLDPRTNHLYIGDVGWTEWEEINVARGGENFGWPCYEGTGRTRGYQDIATCKSSYAANTRHNPPLYTYPHAKAQAAAIGGPFYNGTSYPSQYKGRVFFADYAQQNIRTIGTNISHVVTSPAAIFGSDLGAPVSLHTEVNGDISYADIITGKIKRLRYAAGNRAPTAAATATNNPATLEVTVDASASSDLDGDALTYSTNFGDGTTLPGVKPVHRYGADGTYTVKVTVADPLGKSDSVTLTVKPSNHTPDLTMTAPPVAKKFAVGEPVPVSAVASDAEDGPLTPTRSVILQHCPFGGSCHAHPEDPGLSTFPDHGDETKMVVTYSVTDSAGAIVSKSYEALPDIRLLTVKSPVPVTIGGFTVTSLPVVAGQSITVAAPTMSNGRQFKSWSDGGAATHAFPMPRADLVLTADYLTEIDTKYAQPGVAAGLGAPTGTESPFTAGSLLGGKYRLYQKGVIMWSQQTGAHYVKGLLFQRYWPGGTPYVYGFPTADEVALPGGYASYFQRGHEYWSPATGAKFVKGAILVKYLSLGGSAWGFPTVDEAKLTDGVGYVSHFYGGKSIFWSPATGAKSVQGKIRTKYASLGWERSCLRYPIQDEVSVSVGRQSNFQRGWIVWNSRTGAVTHGCR